MINMRLERRKLLDKFLFDEAMEDRENYEAAASILLEAEEELLGRTQTEKEFRASPDLRQKRLGFVSVNREKTIYYTEM